MAEVAFDLGVADALDDVVVLTVRLVGLAGAVGVDTGALDAEARGFRPC
jgi:hypothetical protein